MSLTVCLLTRNEENTVARAVRSVREVADEVLVADTASTDRTAEVAGEAGAAVTQFAWEDDFSAGRNHLLARATGDWILWLDAKEELTPQSVEPLKQAIARVDAFGFFVRVQHVADGDGRVVGETADLRLFRRREDLRFVGRLHPHFEPAVVEAVKAEGLAVGPCDVVLRHHAQPGPPGEAKLRWNARLLELELRDRPGQIHYLIEHGRTLLLLKEDRGHHVMAAAADQVLAARDASRPPSAKVQVLLQYLLTADPERSRSHLSPEDARELALRWFPNSPALLWTMAEQRFRAGEYDRAANLLERLVRLGKSGTFDRSQAFAPEIVGEQAVLNLGMCHMKLGRPAEAEACFLQVAPSPAFGALARQQLDALRRSGGPPR
jgi:hypothetical protein